MKPAVRVCAAAFVAAGCHGSSDAGRQTAPVAAATLADASAALPVRPVVMDPAHIQLEYGLTEAGNRLENAIDRTVNGRLTCAEVLGHREFVLTRLFPSA